MNNLNTILCTLFFVIIPLFGHSQMSVQDAQNAPFTPQNLITDVFLGEGVDIVNITYDGNPISVGFFSEGGNTIGLDEGIVLTSGAVESGGANNGILENGSLEASVDNESSVIDVDATSIATADVRNVSKYTIEFIPSTDKISFTYVFASEEYPEFVCSEFNDIFGLFISGPGISGTFSNGAINIAQIPGTNLPVTINNVNGGVVGDQGSMSFCTPPNGSLSNSQYFIDNDGTSSAPVYDGYLTPFTAEATVIPCETYTLKIVIADQRDHQRDSGVFLAANSLSSNSIQADVSLSSIDGFLTEGCDDGTLTFSIDEVTTMDTEISISFFDSAMEGIDFNSIASPVVIPAGQTSVDVTFSAIEDNMVEGIEMIGIDFQANSCNRDTFFIGIRDNELTTVSLEDTIICANESVDFDATISFSTMTTVFNSTNNNLAIVSPPPIGSPTIPTTSTISVSGLDAVSVNTALIKDVCLNIQHTKVDDLDIYLYAPNGAFIPLSLRNGGANANYTNTCFSPAASNSISSASAPFTGSFSPEGDWTDFDDSPVNGTWEIVVIDNNFGFSGILEDWSIEFNATYDIDYNWTPATGLSCSDCPNPIASPTATTTYTVEITDIYGCNFSTDATVEVLDQVAAPSVSCEDVTENSITFIWDMIGSISAYEINVDGSGWESPNTSDTSHVVMSLSEGQTVAVEVRAIVACGTADIATLDCTTSTAACDLQISTEVIDIDCDGNLGSISVLVTGGTYPFQFEWDNMTTDSILTDLGAGMYSLTVTDANSCTQETSAEISAITPISLSVESTPSECGGNPTGTATVTATDGSGTFTYLWNDPNAQTTSTAIDLAPGQYQVVVEDTNGCIDSITTNVTTPTLMEISNSTITPLSCGSTDDASIEVEVSGGSGTYFYLWDDPNNQTSQIASNLMAGTYMVEISDDMGCVVTASFTIEASSSIMIETLVEDMDCEGNLGSISLVVTNGTAPYQYVWDNMETDSIITGLSSGMYLVTVTDATNCTQTASAEITEMTGISLDISSTPSECGGTPTGTATVVASGGSEMYTYLWNDPNAQTTDIATGLAPGQYEVIVEDSNGCIATETVNVTTPTLMEISNSTITPLSCGSTDDASIEIEISGGSGTYTYSWDDPNNQSTAIASGLMAGTYMVEVSDDAGCVITASFTVEASSSFMIDSIVENIDCNGNLGSITVVIPDGTGPFQFEWNTMATDSILTDLNTGNYNLTVTDANSCTQTASIEIVEQSTISLDITSTPSECGGNPTGTATVTPTGGSGTYTYLWNDPNAQTTSTATNLAPGMYEVTVEDSDGCMATTTTNVSTPTMMEISTSTVNPISCNGANDASIELTISGGSGNYFFQWDDPNNQMIATASDLASGTYNVEVADDMGCVVIANFTIEEPDTISIDANITDITCPSDPSGQITLTTSGGTGVLQYLWSNNETTATINNLVAGNYAVTVSDENGCIQQDSFTVLSGNDLSLVLNYENDPCENTATSIEASVSGGAPTYTYSWSNGETSSTISNLTEGMYTLTLTDANNCAIQDSVYVIVATPISSEIEMTPATCPGDADASLTVLPSGGISPYTYSLDGGLETDSSTFANLTAGNYILKVIDSMGCVETIENIIIEDPNAMIIDIDPQITIELGDELVLDAFVLGGTPDYTYLWEGEYTNQMSCIDCPTTSGTIYNDTEFLLTVTDSNACVVQQQIIVQVEKDLKIYAPNIFSPDGDGINDIFTIYGEEGTIINRLQIFSRWGDELFIINSDFNVNEYTGWDGMYRGKEADIGVYVWTAEVTFIDGTTQIFMGDIVLSR